LARANIVCARARFLARPRYLTLANPHSCLTIRKACSPRARVRERARLIIRQRLLQRPATGSPIDPVAHSPTLEKRSIVFLPVRLIAEDFPLLSVQQVRQLSDVGDCGVGRSHRMHDTALIRSDVQLHSEVPILALAGLLHLRVASRTRVLGRTRRRDDGCVHDGTRAQQQPPFFQQASDRIEDRLSQPMALQQVAKAQNRALIRHHLVAQLHPRETPHRFAIVNRIFRLRVRQIEPLLQEVNPQHLLHSQRLSSVARLRIVRCDQPKQPRPRNHRIHLGQKPFAPRHLALGLPCHRSERPLISHHLASASAVPPIPLYLNRSTCAEVP